MASAKGTAAPRPPRSIRAIRQALADTIDRRMTETVARLRSVARDTDERIRQDDAGLRALRRSPALRRAVDARGVPDDVEALARAGEDALSADRA